MKSFIIFTLLSVTTACRLFTPESDLLIAGEFGPDLEFKNGKLDSFAAGSCYKVDLAKTIPVWKTARSLKTDMWFWLGDSIYADTHESAVKKDKWATILSNPDYQSLPFIWGVYDDHDFGANNQEGGNWPHSAQAQKDFQDFLSIPENSPLRKRKGHYGLIRYRMQQERVVDFVYLDTRYHKKPRFAGFRGKMLGDEQWEWLDKYVEKSKAHLVFVVSGSQVLTKTVLKETWARSGEQDRFLNTLNKIRGKVIVLSGDRHFGEVSRRDDIHEVTTSGMTHFKTAKQVKDKNKFAIAPRIHELNIAKFNISWRGQGNELTPYVEVRFINPEDGRYIRQAFVI